MTGHRARRVLRCAEPAAAIALLVAGTVVLHRMGAGSLAAPGDRSVDGLAAWAADRDPATTTIALVRLVALAVAWQQLGMVALGTVGRLLHLPRLVSASARATLPGLRRATVGMAGVGLTVSTLLATPAIAGATPPAPGTTSTVTLQLVDPVPTTATLTLVEAEHAAAPDGEVTFTQVDQQESAGPAAPAGPTAGSASRHPGPWTVVLGDHLWSIAERTLRDADDAAPDDAAIARYWRELVVANGDLVDADLILPGQVVTRPPLG